MYVTTDFGLLCGCVIEKRRGEIEKRLFNDIICLVYISPCVKKNHHGCVACSFMHIHLYGDAGDFWRWQVTNCIKAMFKDGRSRIFSNDGDQKKTTHASYV